MTGAGAGEGRRGEASPAHGDLLAAARAALAPGQAAWLVGGCVRDELLGRATRDIDIVVSGGAEALARRLADRLGGSVYASSAAFGTWRVIAGGAHVDVAPLRLAPLEAAGGVERGSLRDDLLSRDFTINAMARPLAGGDLIDPLGGSADLRDARLRLCAPAALQADPLRVVRLARLACDFGMVPDEAALAAADRASSSLFRVSGERLRDELCSLLALPRAAEALRDLASWGALAPTLPEVDALRSVEQNPYHHLDVFEHTLEALAYVRGVVKQMGGQEQLTRPAETGMPDVEAVVPVSWAVLLHDIGKPATRAVAPDGRVVFWNHDEVGCRMAGAIARRLGMSNRFSSYLSTLVRQHLRLGFLVREQPLTRRALARYRRDVSPWVFESVVVSLCDRLATRGEKTSLVSIAQHYRVARSVWTQVSKGPIPKLLTGEEVMNLLALEPGPEVGLALGSLEEEVDAGEVTSADEARIFLARWWQRREAQGHDNDVTETGRH